jgi:hypothetical protein
MYDPEDVAVDVELALTASIEVLESVIVELEDIAVDVELALAASIEVLESVVVELEVVVLMISFPFSSLPTNEKNC